MRNLAVHRRHKGRCGLYPRFSFGGGTVTGEAALAFYIAREFWGRGLASEAALAFVRFGWEGLHLSRIVASVEVGNDASARILEKIGFNLIATERGPRSFLKFAICNPASNENR